MKTYQTDKIRNIALIGNGGSGKTTLAEAMLFEGGVIERRGTVNGNNTVSDYNEIEHENLNSVFSTVLYTEINDHKINIIDTPGADDYIGGVISSFSVVDLAVMLINSQQGVEVGTEILNRHCDRYHKPLMFVVNRLDHENANFEKTLESLKTTFGNKAVVVQYPIDTGANFNAIIDVITMKMYKFADGKTEVADIPADQMATAEDYHNTLIESAAENDEQLMELFFEKGSLDENEMRKGLSAGLIARGLFPIFCASAEKNYGTRRILEFIVNVAPSPKAMPAMKTADGKEIECKENGDTNLFVFKTTNESHIGEINYFKVISGQVNEGIDLTNVNSGAKERLAQLYVVAGKNRAKVTALAAGDIGAAVKLKNTKTNHTLSNAKDTVKFPPISFPNSKYRTAISG